MESKSFRIGNITNFGKVIEINTVSFYVRDEEGTEVKSSWADVKPILITEEWLVKIGYEKTPSGTYLQPNSGNFIWFEQGLKCCIAGEYYPENIKYVHQLQNLYFALTGEELKNS